MDKTEGAIDPTEPVFTTRLEHLVDDDTMGEVLDRFVDIIKIPIRLFDQDNTVLLERSVQNLVCQYMASKERGQRQCLVVRQRVKAISPEDYRGNEVTSVVCFCGLEYMVLPIVFQSAILGKMVVGPYFPAHLDKLPDKLTRIIPDHDPERVKSAFNATPRLSQDRLLKFANLINAILESIFFSVHKANVISQMHTEMIRESFREISQKNRKLEDMVEAQKEFDRRKSNFLAMVSHELRTPLTSIIGYSDMLAEGIAGELADEQKQFIRTIKAKGDDLLKIISSILDFSKVDSGRLDLKPIPSNVNDIIEQALKPNKAIAQRRGVTISLQIPAGMPVVSLDPEKIIVSVSHLVDNALKFSAPGSSIRVSAEVVASTEDDTGEDGIGFVLMAAPDMLEISVEDSGIGIDTDNVDSLFAPFSQADQSSTREHGGAGLGLAIVKQYVEAHGGRIFVQSKKNEGSCFSIRIPITNS